MEKMEHTFLIGIDGGGTGCRVAIADANLRLISEATAGPANIATAFDQSVFNIGSALSAAAHGAGIDKKDLRSAQVHLGLAGVMDKAGEVRVASSLNFEHCQVTDDRPTNVMGALAGADGYLLSVGTGTIAAASNQGQCSYVGSWGFFIADQASGAWLGRHILDRTLQSYDKVIPISPLTSTLLKEYNNDPRAIVSFSLTAAPVDYAAYAPQVIEAAEAGDAIALKLMQEGSDYLMAALRALGHKSDEPVCLAGGVGKHYKPYLGKSDAIEFLEPKGSAITGALYLAKMAFDQRLRDQK
jgi:glucosamine kinase